ncbi:hypothetical protein JAAARDRAFT_158736 [Jaapia argillacea MUCL 33604]|uniref:Palmitoyltransferase n=1 Tax=Jaapia argillacea MUCL 33604 TaxID=933084 RepID=A0A067PQ91_9AGAM|nr:hypothetical protein JAAARDRAFT_158736 [Jaapia argillacea MUCL 33604]
MPPTPPQAPPDENACCALISEAQARSDARRAARTHQPWIALKFAVGLTVGLLGYTTYVYIARFCVGIIRGRTQVVGKAAGVGFLVVFCVFGFMTWWSYIKVVLTPPGFARDHVAKSAAPPRPPSTSTISFEDSIGGWRYEGMSQVPPPPPPPTAASGSISYQPPAHQQPHASSHQTHQPNQRDIESQTESTLLPTPTALKPKQSTTSSLGGLKSEQRYMDSFVGGRPPRSASFGSASGEVRPGAAGAGVGAGAGAGGVGGGTQGVATKVPGGPQSPRGQRKASITSQKKEEGAGLKVPETAHFGAGAGAGVGVQTSSHSLGASHSHSPGASHSHSQGPSHSHSQAPSHSHSQPPSHSPGHSHGASHSQPPSHIQDYSDSLNPTHPAGLQSRFSSASRVRGQDPQPKGIPLPLPFLSKPQPQPQTQTQTKPRIPGERKPPSIPVLLPEYRYCYRDELVKPMRCHHCRSCGTCVLRYDHHCPWIGQCVGAFNHKFFYIFLEWSSLFCLWTFSTVLAVTVRSAGRGDDVDVQEIVIIALAGLFSLFTLTMLISHTHLIVLNMTTVEHLGVQRMKEREREVLGGMFGLVGFSAKRRTKREWDEEWGRIGKEGNLWWLGGWKENWVSVMGGEPLGWFLPIGKRHENGMEYPMNPRFDEQGRWRRRVEWPKEVRGAGGRAS